MPNVSHRLVLTGAVFAICYLLIYEVPFNWIPVDADLLPFAKVIALAFSSTLAWFAWSRSKSASAGLLASVVGIAAIVAGLLFIVSALSGPFLFPAKPNQGVHLGLFFWGPVGAVIGGTGGLIISLIRTKSRRNDGQIDGID
jgi:hypothetical protein